MDKDLLFTVALNEAQKDAEIAAEILNAAEWYYTEKWPGITPVDSVGQLLCTVFEYVEMNDKERLMSLLTDMVEQWAEKNQSYLEDR